MDFDTSDSRNGDVRSAFPDIVEGRLRGFHVRLTEACVKSTYRPFVTFPVKP
jgi:hypothetical protein